MPTRFRTYASKGLRVLEDLKVLAAAGDMDKFINAMRIWDAVKTIRFVNIDIYEQFELQCHHDIRNIKTALLHWVLIAAAEAGQVDIVRYLIDKNGCVIYIEAIRATFELNRWGVLELVLKKGWDINSSVGGNDTYTILRYVISLIVLYLSFLQLCY